MEWGIVISSAIFLLVYAVIVSEKIDRVVVALAGGIMMVLLRIINQENAFSAIDFDTIGLLISMMVIVLIMQKTGVFEFLAIKVIKLAKGEPWKILINLTIITAILSAFLNNVTTMLLILPITFDVARELKIKPIPFIISQIFASNIGGTATLVGDPPNIMIASKAPLGFMDFIYNTAPIAIVLTAVSAVAFLLIYKKELKANEDDKKKINLLNEHEAIKDKKLLIKSVIILALTIVGFVLSGVLNYGAATIGIAGAVLLLLISKVETEKIFKNIEWKTIFFFVGLFIVVGGIEKAGVLKLIANEIFQLTGSNQFLLTISILWISAILSAFVDNIPFTATMIPLIKQVGILSAVNITPLWWALVLGACLGGNGTIIGASANVIASGIAEENGHKITFAYYFKVCFPIMILTILISMVYLIIMYF